jgi:GH15 family glucan-1,4-alpha-glucosidase
MNEPRPMSGAFPPIARHGVIGDRRTGALVAADGTIDWFCAPEFDGPPLFGALLDPERGGFCRFGPPALPFGRQRYLPGTAALETTWPSGTANGVGLTLTDIMAWPEEERPDGAAGQRVIIRRLYATAAAAARFQLAPRRNFSGGPLTGRPEKSGAVFSFADGSLGVWASFPMQVDPAGASADLALGPAEEHWVVIGWNTATAEWDAARAAQLFIAAENYWRNWSAELEVDAGGARTAALRRSALTVQLLSHAHHDSAVAALTTSLPERLGGDRNYDYRYAWVRDASLSLALLARLGKAGEVEHYLGWLCGLHSAGHGPLQVCYRLDGDPHIEQEEIAGVTGYEHSRPVYKGNRAAKQKQLGAFGFFADCARIYVDHGGRWREEFWQLLKRGADFTCRHWAEKDNGVWELTELAHHVASRVMGWVVLERAVYIAGRTGHAAETDHWRETAAEIHAEVMDKGWCEEKNSFRQRYGSDALDAAVLLIPLMDFLPADHPRVLGTFAAIERELVIDGLVHRFDPAATLGGHQLPIGRFEGAFLPCVFWHAHALAKAGRCDQAERILARCEAISGETGLFAEEADARHDTFLGNTPLLFSHVEYVRAVLELNHARTRAAKQAGK